MSSNTQKRKKSKPTDVDEKTKSSKTENTDDMNQKSEECRICDLDNDGERLICIYCYVKEKKPGHKISEKQKQIANSVMNALRDETNYGFGDQIEECGDYYENLLNDIITGVMESTNDCL